MLENSPEKGPSGSRSSRSAQPESLANGNYSVQARFARALRALNDHPDDPEKHFAVAELYADRGAYDEAIDRYQRVITANPSSREHLISAHVGRAMAIIRKGKSEGFPKTAAMVAVHACKGVLEVDPLNARICFELGRIQYYFGEHEEAVESLTKAVQSDPANAHACFLLGFSAVACGNPPLAETAFRKAARLSPDDPKIQYELAQLFASTKREKEALVAYEKALSLDPSNSRYHDKVSLFRERRGSKEEMPPIEDLHSLDDVPVDVAMANLPPVLARMKKTELELGHQPLVFQNPWSTYQFESGIKVQNSSFDFKFYVLPEGSGEFQLTHAESKGYLKFWIYLRQGQEHTLRHMEEILTYLREGRLEEAQRLFSEGGKVESCCLPPRMNDEEVFGILSTLSDSKKAAPARLSSVSSTWDQIKAAVGRRVRELIRKHIIAP